MWWAAHILATLDGLAIVHGPGGLLVVDDPQQQLRADASTMIVATPPNEPPPAGLQLGTWSARRLAGLTVLSNGLARLVLPPAPELGDTVQLTITVRPTPCPPCSPSDAWACLLNDCDPASPTSSTPASADPLLSYIARLTTPEPQ